MLGCEERHAEDLELEKDADLARKTVWGCDEWSTANWEVEKDTEKEYDVVKADVRVSRAK